MSNTTAITLRQKWEDYAHSKDPAKLRALLHDDCCFLSPVVFAPQQGTDLVMAYLQAASMVFDNSAFRYAHELLGENRMVLEFEAEIDGKYINGVDIVDFDADGLITQFKVMVRPLQAVNMVWQKMGEMLETRKSA